MPADQPKRSVWPTIFRAVVLLVALAALYMAAYYSILHSLQWMSNGTGIWADHVAFRHELVQGTPDPVVRRDVGYTMWVVEPVFRPAHWFDKKLRPNYWRPFPKDWKP